MTLTNFAGWGPCGALNEPGENEFYFLGFFVLLLGLGLTSLVLLLANSRFVQKFTPNKSPRPFYLILNYLATIVRLFVIYVSLSIAGDYFFGDANMSAVEVEGVACDPIDINIVLYSLSLVILAGFLIFRQIRRYRREKAQS